MGRRLRYIDGAEEIKEWAVAMTALNAVLKELDMKGYSDNWRPWKRPIRPGKEDLRKMRSQSWEGTLAYKQGKETEIIERRNNPDLSEARPPRVYVEGDDEEMCDPKTAVMEMLNRPQKENLSESVDLAGDEIMRGGDVNTNRGGTAVDVTNDLEETSGEERRRGDSAAKEKIKLWWKEALWRKLKEEEQEQEYWAASEDFTRLLFSTGNDKELSKNLTEMFPRETGNSFLVISKENLRVYLNKEMNNFYLLKTWSK